MTEYDFTTRPNRLNQHSIKWKTSEQDPDLLQLWIADMDFEPLPELRQAIIDYGENHIFGYNYPSDDLYKAIINWEKRIINTLSNKKISF